MERTGPKNWDQFLKIGLPEAGPLGGAPKLGPIFENWFAEGRTPRPSPKFDLLDPFGPYWGPLRPIWGLLGPLWSLLGPLWGLLGPLWGPVQLPINPRRVSLANLSMGMASRLKAAASS